MMLAPQLLRKQGDSRCWLMRICSATAIGLLVCSGVYPVQDTANLLPVKNLYSNYDYAYSVRIPRGLTAFQSRPPFPNHGFVIKLSDHPEAELAVSASYNAAEWSSFDDAVNAHLRYFKDEGGGEVGVISRAPAVLGGFKAIRFTMKPKTPAVSDPQVREVLLALREEPGGVGIVYEVVLTTPSSRYAKDRQLLTELQRSWRMKPLPR